MDRAVLVVADLAADLFDNGRRLVQALDSRGLRFDAAFWLLESDSYHWRLYLGRHGVRETGSLELYKQIDGVLESLGMQERLWIGMIRIADMTSKLITALNASLGSAVSVDGTRLDNAFLDDAQLPGCVLYRLNANQCLGSSGADAHENVGAAPHP